MAVSSNTTALPEIDPAAIVRAGDSSATMDAQAIPPAANSMEKIMNQHINRRSFFRNTAAVGAAGATVAVPVVAVAADPSLAELKALISAQAKAYRTSTAKWDVAADIEDTPAMQNAPLCRVQVGRLLGPRDDEGNDTWTPIYAYSDEEIVAKHQGHLDASIAMAGSNEDAKKRIRDRYEERINQKKAELAVLRAEVDRINDECGYTAAEKEAVAATDAAEAIEAAIVAFVPGSLAAAARKAAWIVAAYNDDDVKSYLCREHVLGALASIGKAVSL